MSPRPSIVTRQPRGRVRQLHRLLTLLNLAGLPVPRGVDGRPFLGEGVSLAEVNRRDETVGCADRFDEKYDLVRTLRCGRFNYMRSYQPFNFDGLRNDCRYKMLAYAEWRDLGRSE